MSWPVELYIYDLSGGLAHQFSGSLLGRQLDAVYHTSIVVHGKEHFFGHGISVTAPGGSHHGRPMETIVLGTTEIDQETWQALLDDLRQRFTPAAYSLMTFNCNTFSNECANILVGADIPTHILSLPTDFQSALSGLIGPTSSSAADTHGAGPSPLLDLLSQMDQRGRGLVQLDSTPSLGSAPAPLSSTTLTVSNLFNVVQSEQLDSLLSQWPCAAVLFTNTRTCPPCKVIHPVFESLAAEYAPASPKANRRRIAFIVVDSSPASMALMSSHGIRGTPTFKFFVKSKLRHYFSGADPSELRSQIELTLFDVYHLHPHTKLQPPLASLRDVPQQPIVVAAIPSLTSALRILDESISAIKAADFKTKADLQDARKSIAKQVIPWLEVRFAPKESQRTREPLTMAVAAQWKKASTVLYSQLASSAIYPLVDMLRLTVTDAGSASVALQSSLTAETIKAASSVLSSGEASLRPVWLTSLRLLGNLVAICVPRSPSTPGDTALTDLLSHHKDALIEGWVMAGMTHTDKTVRNAATSVAFNLALWRVAGRGEFVARIGQDQREASSASSSINILGEDFEMDFLPCVLEAVKNEAESADALHRLLAAMLLLVYLHPQPSNIAELLAVLEARDVLEAQITSDLVKSAGKGAIISNICKDIMRITAAASLPSTS